MYLCACGMVWGVCVFIHIYIYNLDFKNPTSKLGMNIIFQTLAENISKDPLKLTKDILAMSYSLKIKCGMFEFF